MKPETIERCRRVCVVCGTRFLARDATRVGKTCGKACLSQHMSRQQKGVKQTPEVVAKRAAAMRAKYRNDPEWAERRRIAATESVREWHKDPKNAAAFSARMSERMRRRHTEPEFQKRRDERSSRTMKATWEKHRVLFSQQAAQRYARMAESGTGLCAADTVARKVEATKWIMKKAATAMRAETNYNEVYTEVQARLRREMPYDGPQDGSEYMDYLQKLGSAVVSSPECRTIADSFMSEAIPRFAAEWNKRKAMVSG